MFPLPHYCIIAGANHSAVVSVKVENRGLVHGRHRVRSNGVEANHFHMRGCFWWVRGALGSAVLTSYKTRASSCSYIKISFTERWFLLLIVTISEGWNWILKEASWVLSHNWKTCKFHCYSGACVSIAFFFGVTDCCSQHKEEEAKGTSIIIWNLAPLWSIS